MLREQEPTISDVLEAINTFAGHVDGKFEQIDQRLNKIESQMVTKEYLDNKLADLRGEATLLVRKEDKKLTALVTKLNVPRALSKQSQQEILAMEPFAPISL